MLAELKAPPMVSDMDKYTFAVTYSVRFSSEREAARLTPAQFKEALFRSMDGGLQLLLDDDADTYGVEHGDLEIIAVRDIGPLERDYDVSHRLAVSPDADDAIERVALYLAETLGLPQQDARWNITELTISPIDQVATAPVRSRTSS